MLEAGFPHALAREVQTVEKLISGRLGCTQEACRYVLPDGERISFPYRIYAMAALPCCGLSPEQEQIYHCIGSRSSNGFARERHIQALLAGEIPAWASPYILKISDEYVVEILEQVYQGLRQRDLTEFRAVCRCNLPEVLRGHNRMISYWNEYYRTRWPRRQEYIGEKLFTECFGYTCSMERVWRSKGGGTPC